MANHGKGVLNSMYRHGFAHRGNKHPLYRVWSNMRSRCLNPKSDHWAEYGGDHHPGGSVMPYAVTSGRSFLEVAMKMANMKWSPIDPAKPSLGWRKGRWGKGQETAVAKWEHDKFTVYAQAVASR